MNRVTLAIVLLITLGCGAAWAASSCPVAPPPAIKFESLASPFDRDLSKTATELALASGSGEGTWRYELYAPVNTSIAMNFKMRIELVADGERCGALTEVTFKLGFKRKIAIAREAAENACVTDAFASEADAITQAEDSALSAFGGSIAAAYGADIGAIGTVKGADQDAIKAALGEKLSTLLHDTIFPGFEDRLVAAYKTIDMRSWKPAECGEDTKKIVSALVGVPKTNSDIMASYLQTLQSKSNYTSSGMGMGGMGMGMGMGMGR